MLTCMSKCFKFLDIRMKKIITEEAPLTVESEMNQMQYENMGLDALPTLLLKKLVNMQHFLCPFCLKLWRS